ncbi:MAG: response regulator [Anaerolineae bacterium]
MANFSALLSLYQVQHALDFTRYLRGYSILKAATGEEGLRLAKEHVGPIHLLVTDVVMPQMSGKELVERLKLIRPRTKVLFISGYTDNDIHHHGILDEDVAFLQKPFSEAALAKKVREVLDGNGRSH